MPVHAVRRHRYQQLIVLRSTFVPVALPNHRQAWFADNFVQLFRSSRQAPIRQEMLAIIHR